MFKGVYTALITPFKYGELDEKAFIKMVEWQIDSGVHGLVAGGTCGEASTLTRSEHLRVIELAIQVAKGKIPVIAGTGSNSTQTAIELSLQAQELGCDGLLLISPYYNRPTQEGLYQHYKAIHEATNLPIIIYNHPGRSAVDVNQDTLIRLAELPRIVALKDASGQLSRVTKLKIKVKDNFYQLAADDENALGFNAQGGVGCISTAANVVPGLCARIQDLWIKGEVKEAMLIQEMLMPLYDVLFCESNPVPVKYIANLIGLCDPDVRLPLAPLSEKNKKMVKDAVADLENKLQNYEQQKVLA